MKILAVRDLAIQGFMTPFFVHAAGGAVRSFGDECQRDHPDNQIFKHPDDYELYELGEYFEVDAQFQIFGSPRLLARGADFKG